MAEYGAFFDWNGDGVFGPGEGYTGQIGTTTTLGETKVLSIAVPCNAVQIVYMRFRLALNPAEVQSGTGTAMTGEVEDYVLATIGDRVWYDNNKDGLQGPVNLEPGVPGVVATVCDGNTGSQSCLPVSRSRRRPTPMASMASSTCRWRRTVCSLTWPRCRRTMMLPSRTSGAIARIDSDADLNGRTNATGVLTPGQIDLTLDMGIYNVNPTSENPVEEPAGSFRVYLPALKH